MTKRLSYFVWLAALWGLASTGCQEIEARRLIQKADSHYLEGRQDKAIELYEQALEIKSDLAVGQHNAGLAYYQLYTTGQGDQHAVKAAEHFQKYLEVEPGDMDIQKLLTKTWEDSGQVEEAVAFWQAKLDKDPNNRDVLNQLAAVNINADRVKEGLAWLWKLAEAETETAGKIQAYLTIGRTAMGRLGRAELVDEPRLALADEGIAALQAALELEPENMQIHGLLNAIYQRRALAHGASWARLLDLSAARSHYTKFRALEKKAQSSKPASAEPEKAEKDN